MQKTYTKILFILLLFSSCLVDMSAQQDPMFTQYMFNSLTFNPAYAGSKDYLSTNILYRAQWAGWNDRNKGLNPELSTGGAPVSQTLTAHTPLSNRVGFGLSIVNDKIGAHESTGANFSYAYRIPFTKGKLAFGIQAGMMNFRADFRDLIAKDDIFDDPAFVDMTPSVWRPNFGAGVYYHSEKFYLGVSVPRLLEISLRKEVSILDDDTRLIARGYQHFYVTAGGAIPINGNPDFVFKPSVLVKSVGLFSELQRRGSSTEIIGAPTEFDIDASVFIKKTIWLGVSFRSSFETFIIQESSYDSADVWLGFYLKNGIRIAGAYDFSLTPIQRYSVGSFELSLGYDFNFSNVEKTVSPRYF